MQKVRAYKIFKKNLIFVLVQKKRLQRKDNKETYWVKYLSINKNVNETYLIFCFTYTKDFKISKT